MKRKTIIKLIIFGCILVVLSLSIIFSKFFETLLYLKPNLNTEKGDFEIHFVDVGQGDTILIKLSDGTTIIVDAGTTKYESKLISYIDNVFFKDNKDKFFDYVILTHSEIDHCGNMPVILNKYKIGTFIRPRIYVNGIDDDIVDGKSTYDNNKTYVNIIKILKDKSINTVFSSSDLDLGNNLKILSPIKNHYSSLNDYSTVLKVVDKNVKCLLMGDASTDIEEDIINNYDSSQLESDIIKLGHHGSSTSTSLDFLEIVKPSFAVISVADNNSYNLPSTSVLNNIDTYNLSHDKDITLYQTNVSGNIIMYSDGDKIENINLANIDNYIFISWWVVVVVLIVIIAISMFTSNILSLLNKNKTTNVKRL